MKRISILALTCLSLGMSTSVFAKGPEKKTARKTASMQLPISHSAAMFKAVLKDVEVQGTLSMMQIKAIKFSGGSGKVELISNDGTCSAIPYSVSFDKMGLNPQAKPMTDAIAQCD